MAPWLFQDAHGQGGGQVAEEHLRRTELQVEAQPPLWDT